MRLIAQGLMTPVGMEKVELAKRNGTWGQYAAIEDLTAPDDLAAALAANPEAQRYRTGPESPCCQAGEERPTRLEKQAVPELCAPARSVSRPGASWRGVRPREAPGFSRGSYHFDAFPPSSRKNIFWWINTAKRPETRQKRVEETVRLAAQNLKASHYHQ
jgi:hypothetical protein